MNGQIVPATQPPDFRDLASRISRTRNDFGRVYDEVRAAVPGTRPFLAVSAGAKSDQIAFERALRLANEEDWFTQLGERLIHDGFFPVKSAAVTNLQALISVDRGFTDPSVVEKGWLRARARLCRVEVAKDGEIEAVTGTGFLVGPSTVLTAFHVVRRLIDDLTDAPKPRSERQLRVRFDHATGQKATAEFKVPQSWLVASSRPHPAEIDVEHGAPVLVSPEGSADLSGFLDYAVILVAGSPGAERGFYNIRDVAAPMSGCTVHLFQHPMGLQQRQADGAFRGFRDPTTQQRINHTANAVPGSSGGLLLDGNYSLIGLHQGAHGKPVVNTAISAIAIRDHVLAQNVDLLDSKYLQAFRVADRSRPILGRSTCQELIRRVSKPLVRVRPFLGSKGVSFTHEIIRACLPEGEHVVKRVQVLELDSDAMRTAKLLLDRLGVETAGLPAEADANSSRGAWLEQLTAAFGARVEKAHRDQIVWLVIDDLQKEKPPIPDGSVREFLAQLYKQSSNFKNLRIVLLGMSDFPSGFPTGFVEEEEISPPNKTDIVAYLRLRLTENGIDHSSAEVNRLAELIWQTSGADITALSDYVADKVDRVLDMEIEEQT